MNAIMIIRDRALTAGEALLGRIWLDGMDIGVTLEKKSRAVDKGSYKGEVFFSPKSQRKINHPRPKGRGILV